MRQLLKRNQVYKRWFFNQSFRVSCLLCRADTAISDPLCHLCCRALPIAECNCQYCGIPIVSGSVEICAHCIKKRPAFDQCHSAWSYEYPVNHLIQKIKYQQQLTFLPPLARQLALVLKHKYDNACWPDAVVPVPLHNHRLRKRGFDQSLLLAKAVIKSLRPELLHLDDKLVKRIKNTKAQQSLKASERKKNIRGAFGLRKQPSRYQHVAIVDDVVTTGETVSEIAKLLKQSGIERIDIWCLARTPD